MNKLFRSSLRFPFMALSAIVGFILILVYNHFPEWLNWPGERIALLALEFVIAIPLFFAFAVFSEKNKLDIGKRIGFVLLGFCVVALHFYSLPSWAYSIDASYGMRFFLLYSMFILLTSIALFYKPEEGTWFWNFNSHLFIQLTTSTLYSLVFFLGIGGALLGIEKLFDLNLPNIWYGDIFFFFTIVFNVLFFNSTVLNPLGEYEKDIDFKEPLRIFVQYILLPLLSLYYIILMVYMAKIIITREMPKGYVCQPILIFAILGLLSYLLIFPIRNNQQYPYIKLFSRYFFHLLLPLLVLYAFGIYHRVLSYGLTELRYLVIALGVWLAVVSVYILMSKKRLLQVFPVTLLIILFISSVGPWGMFQASARSQASRLQKLLKESKLLTNKVLDTKKLREPLPPHVQDEISSIAKFLFYREEIHLIYPMLAEDQKKQIDRIVKGENKVSAFNDLLRNTFQIEQKKLLEQRFEFYTDTRNVFKEGLDLKGYRKMYYYELGHQDSLSSYLSGRDTLILNGHVKIDVNKIITRLIATYRNGQKDMEFTSIKAGPDDMQVMDTNQQAKIMIDHLEVYSVQGSYYVDKISFYFMHK